MVKPQFPADFPNKTNPQARSAVGAPTEVA